MNVLTAPTQFIKNDTIKLTNPEITLISTTLNHMPKAQNKPGTLINLEIVGSFVKTAGQHITAPSPKL
jgi:hypothetical protein